MIELFHKHSNKIYVFALVLLSILVHNAWFNPTTALTSGDWGYLSPQQVQEIGNVWQTWISTDNFGQTNIQLPFAIFMNIWDALALLGLGYDAVTKITFFIPIALLTFLSPYFLMKNVIENKFAAFIAAIFYATTPYGITNQPPIHVVYALAPLIILLFMKAMQNRRLSSWVYFVLCYNVGLIYEVRIMFLVTLVLLVYLLLHFKFKDRLLYVYGLLSVLLILLLNAFWILPTVLGGASQDIGAIANRGLFGDELADIAHSLALSPWYWTGGLPNDEFIMQTILPHLWVAPIIAMAVVFSPSVARRRITLFFVIIAAAGILYAKQSGEPFSNLYFWSYSNIPGFNLFRESSKFYTLTALGYMGLIGLSIYGLFKLKNKHRNKIIFVASSLVVLSSAVNAFPVVSGRLGGLTVSSPVPPEYKAINETVGSPESPGRALWVPSPGRWAESSIGKPKANAVNLLDNEWLLYSKDEYSTTEQPIESDIVELLQSSFAESLLSESSISHVILPPRLSEAGEDFYRFYGDDRGYYERSLDQISWLKKEADGRNYDIYKNENPKPYIRSSDSVVQINSELNIRQKMDFISKTIGRNELNFVVSKENNNKLPFIKNLFENTDEFISNEGRITDELELKSDETLYIAGSRSIQLKQSGASLSVSEDPIGSLEYDRSAILEESQKITEINTGGSDTYIEIDDQISKVAAATELRSMGVARDYYTVFTAGQSILRNGNFPDESLPPLRDCTDYFDKGDYKKTTNNSREGNYLEVSVNHHIACQDFGDIKLNGAENLLFEFDHNSVTGKFLGYTVEFDENKIGSEKIFNTGGSGWRTEMVRVPVPKNANTAKVTFRFYKNIRQPILGITQLRNVSVKPMKTQVNRSFKDDLKEMSLKGNSNNGSFQFDSGGEQLANLIPDPSFENRLWQEKVSDCNAYDDDPIINMDRRQNIASDGKYSLELSAKRHIACTGVNNIKVKEGGLYYFAFDHQSQNARTAGYYIGFNDKAGSRITEQIDTGQVWDRYKRYIRIPFGADNIDLVMYSYSDERRATINYVNRYDNFFFGEIPDINTKYAVLQSPGRQMKVPKSTDFQNVSTVKKNVKISGGIDPFVLEFAERYDVRWRLMSTNQRVAVNLDDHYRLNNFMNAWYVDPIEHCKNSASDCSKNNDGSYDFEMTIVYVPQKWFGYGKVVSGVTLAGVVVYLIYHHSRRIYRIHAKTK